MDIKTLAVSELYTLGNRLRATQYLFDLCRLAYFFGINFFSRQISLRRAARRKEGFEDPPRIFLPFSLTPIFFPGCKFPPPPLP